LEVLGVKISIATILWGKIPEVKEFAGVLATMRRTGYDGIGFETRFLPKDILEEPKLLPGIVGRSGLENVGSYSSMNPSDVKWAESSGTPLLWVVVRREKKYTEALRVLRKFSKLANDASIVPALHNHLGTCFETEEEVVRALHEVEGLRLCFDTAHAEASGIDSAGFIRKYHEKIALVHLKDLRVRVPKSRVSFTKDFVNIGSGIIDFEPIVSTLADVGYDGYLMLEIDSAKGKKSSPNELARQGFRRVRDLLSRNMKDIAASS
jgi:sugar phosphate isomerase/epimerase